MKVPEESLGALLDKITLTKEHLDLYVVTVSKMG